MPAIDVFSLSFCHKPERISRTHMRHLSCPRHQPANRLHLRRPLVHHLRMIDFAAERAMTIALPAIVHRVTGNATCSAPFRAFLPLLSKRRPAERSCCINHAYRTTKGLIDGRRMALSFIAVGSVKPFHQASLRAELTSLGDAQKQRI